MQEIAKVESTKNQTATLILDKKDECSKCGMCLFPKGAQVFNQSVEKEFRDRVGFATVVIIAKLFFIRAQEAVNLLCNRFFSNNYAFGAFKVSGAKITMSPKLDIAFRNVLGAIPRNIFVVDVPI